MWIPTISFAVGVHRLTSPFTRAISRTNTFKGKKLIEPCCIVFQLKVSQKKGNAGGEILVSRVPVYGAKDAGRGLWLRLKNMCELFNFSLNQVLPTLITLRDDESKIIAVMSSNVDDLLYGYLPEGAEAMNSVLQQFLVVKEVHKSFRFVERSFDMTKTSVFTPQPKTTLSECNHSLVRRNMV